VNQKVLDVAPFNRVARLLLQDTVAWPLGVAAPLVVGITGLWRRSLIRPTARRACHSDDRRLVPCATAHK
jgi:hypothetical protein